MEKREASELTRDVKSTEGGYVGNTLVVNTPNLTH
jgi:hypothetical protein